MIKRKKKIQVAIYVLTLLGFLSFSTLLISEASSGFVKRSESSLETLTAVKVMTAPKLDGDSTDSMWAEATSLTINTAGGSGSISVTVNAVYTDTDLFFLVQWDDSTMSMTRSGSWNWDGASWTTIGASQSEDRVAFLWDINMTDFDSTGCMIKCHPQHGVAGAFLDNPGELGDIWHMKAARSLGVISASQSDSLSVDPETHEVTAGTITMIGYIDDKYLSYENPADLPEDGGRHGDSGSSTYGRNRNADQTGPLYLETDPENYIDAMVLTQSEIDGGETLEVATATAEQISTAWNMYTSFGAVVPERILRTPGGSRGDVMQAATWSDGTWTSEIKRALVTENSDDVQFADLAAKYGFSLSVMDNAGGDGHSPATTTYALEFGVEVSEISIGFNVIALLSALGAILVMAAIRRRRQKD